MTRIAVAAREHRRARPRPRRRSRRAGDDHVRPRGPDQARARRSSPVTGADATECRLDTGPWLDCADEFRAAELADGGHMFVVRAKDRSANDVRSFTVDTVAPSLTLDAHRRRRSRTPTATRRLHRRGRRRHTCAIDSEPAGACATPFTTPT